MSHVLNVTWSEETHRRLEYHAQEAATSPAELAVTALEQRFVSSVDPRGEDDRQAARERFEGHFGAVDLGYATGAENEAIDADLARVYGSDDGND